MTLAPQTTAALASALGNQGSANEIASILGAQTVDTDGNVTLSAGLTITGAIDANSTADFTGPVTISGTSGGDNLVLSDATSRIKFGATSLVLRDPDDSVALTLATTTLLATFGGVVNASAAGLRTKQAVNNVHDTVPTAAELTTSFGDPATLGRGFLGTVDDADGDTNFYIVAVSDASFYFLKMTKAT